MNPKCLSRNLILSLKQRGAFLRRKLAYANLPLAAQYDNLSLVIHDNHVSDSHITMPFLIGRKIDNNAVPSLHFLGFPPRVICHHLPSLYHLASSFPSPSTFLWHPPSSSPSLSPVTLPPSPYPLPSSTFPPPSHFLNDTPLSFATLPIGFAILSSCHRIVCP